MPDLARLRRHLQRGGVIAYATESCFGLGCDPRNRRAVRNILRLKGRPQGKGLILIGSEYRQFRRYLAPVDAVLAARFEDYWPGPYTLLLPTSKRCPKWLTGRHAKLAVRVTAHAETARLCRLLDMALVSTSANRSGRQALKTAAACRREFGGAVWVLPGRIGKRRRPSTIIDPSSGGVLRA
ncbi:MAG: L-threonylcarbamoyladenylate synthase [Hydrogenophilaceae bacterium]|nr:L-threonylcarbamoyladenylate synthase [Hydrogenophilaceae bacterium]